MPRLGMLTLAGVLAAGCRETQRPEPAAAVRPSILLVTLDTTRADAIGPEADSVETPGFNALAARGRRFRQAYATAPETLPSHSSMMTGLYPAGHDVRENGRALAREHPVLADRLRQAGYGTAAFVSTFVLSRRFGLARGYDVYDEDVTADRAERTARETTDRALAHLQQERREPIFLWVHYFDPHHPYAPPEPFSQRYANRPYLGEVAAMDEQLGRLVQDFDRHVEGPVAIVVVGDHGEGLGDHGETQHGNLVYQSTMRVPLVLVGPGIASGASDAPVSTRRVFHTILDWAGLDSTSSLRGSESEVVLGEAMKPFLSYGWLPQVMAVEGRHKAILAGRMEVYDIVADPQETRDLTDAAPLSRPFRTALREYPPPALDAPAVRDTLDEDARRKLASLGYVSAGAPPAVRPDAPRPAERTHLFDVIERASGFFVREEYGQAIPLLSKILAEDPHNLDAALRLATAHSALGHAGAAIAAFDKARSIAPRSPEVRTYLALHYARGTEWSRAVPLLEQAVAESPDRVAALEALAVLRQRQGRISEAIALRRRIYTLRDPSPSESVALGRLAMEAQETALAIESFERARRARPGSEFAHDLELGVLYLAARRLPEARDALDRVPRSHPAYPMALFKRAQVSVLLQEHDRAARIAKARQAADPTTREQIERERLFRQ